MENCSVIFSWNCVFANNKNSQIKIEYLTQVRCIIINY